MFINLECLVNRYKRDTEMLEKHPEYTKEQREIFIKRIEKHKTDIANYVSSERFGYALKAFNL